VEGGCEGRPNIKITTAIQERHSGGCGKHFAKSLQSQKSNRGRPPCHRCTRCEMSLEQLPASTALHLSRLPPVSYWLYISGYYSAPRRFETTTDTSSWRSKGQATAAGEGEGACCTGSRGGEATAAGRETRGKSETMSNSPGLSAVSTVSPLSDAIEAAALAAALAESALGSS
jgi:hypothetical protein